MNKINPEAEITTIDAYLDETSLARVIPLADFVVNTIDFDCPHCITCSDLCRKHGKIEIFPINLSFASVICLFDKNSPTWREIFTFSDSLELKVRILEYFAGAPDIQPYIKETLRRYQAMGSAMPPHDPQLAIASYVTVSMAMSRIIAYLNGEATRMFPDFYYLDTRAPAITGRPARRGLSNAVESANLDFLQQSRF